MSVTRTQGLIFPLELDSGKHVLSEGGDLIKSSIKIILAWPLTTRPYLGEFGSRIHEALEDQNDDILITILRRFVIDSLSTWELRINLLEFNFTRPNNESLIVDLTYEVRELNIQDNLKYTYYTN